MVIHHSVFIHVDSRKLALSEIILNLSTERRHAMKTTKTKFVCVFATLLLAFVLAAPTLAQAGRGHHHHGHHEHHQGHRHHGHHHSHHLNGYMMYNQPRIQYRSYYPQPSYNYYPVPIYIQPSMLGISAGGATFMIGF